MLSVLGKKKTYKKEVFLYKAGEFTVCISINIIFMEIDITMMGHKQMEKIFLGLYAIPTVASK